MRIRERKAARYWTGFLPRIEAMKPAMSYSVVTADRPAGHSKKAISSTPGTSCPGACTEFHRAGSIGASLLRSRTSAEAPRTERCLFSPHGLQRIVGKTPTKLDFLDPSTMSFPSKFNAATDDAAAGRPSLMAGRHHDLTGTREDLRRCKQMHAKHADGPVRLTHRGPRV